LNNKSMEEKFKSTAPINNLIELDDALDQLAQYHPILEKALLDYKLRLGGATEEKTDIKPRKIKI
ncbi:MAG TPA: hypothetical protein VM577_19180, partial [Anaerovoracaceae bacterium]|nr:hypothetical protein [Anaerovoracaceae bacterium]